MTYIAYLDEFGHVGPYIGRHDPKHNDSPVFGFAGLVLPADEVRGFGTWFYQRKHELLANEIEQSDKHSALWEKKGSKFFTVSGITRYPERRRVTHRLFNKIERLGGFVFYVGIRKTFTPVRHRSNQLYEQVLLESIKRIDGFCAEDRRPPDTFLLALDEHAQRPALLTKVAQSMYGNDPRRQLIEPPFHLESHRYQTIQAADWIAALIGRLGAFWVEPSAYSENAVFSTYFEQHLKRARWRSGIRIKPARALP